MKHVTRRPFRSQFAALPSDIQRAAVQAFALLKTNPFHPSLHFKKIGQGIWSARITRGYRAIAFVDPANGNYVWHFIGPHHKYDAEIGR